MDLDDIIYRNKMPPADTDEGQDARAETMVAHIITQLFDYMIDRGVTYGYATGGEAFLFLRLNPDHVNTVYYDWVVPTQAVGTGDNLDLSKTAVGLVLSFAHRASEACAYDGNWSQAKRQELSRWVYDDHVALSLMTPSPERTRNYYSPYRGRAKASKDGAKPTTRSQTKAATSCQPPNRLRTYNGRRTTTEIRRVRRALLFHRPQVRG